LPMPRVAPWNWMWTLCSGPRSILSFVQQKNDPVRCIELCQKRDPQPRNILCCVELNLSVSIWRPHFPGLVGALVLALGLLFGYHMPWIDIECCGAVPRVLQNSGKIPKCREATKNGKFWWTSWFMIY
jgi:hypothetical protein